MSSVTQYRAVVRRPASFLDTPEARTLGYVLYATGPHESKEAAEAAALRRSEESHASVVGYETRTATYTDWETE